MASGAWFSGATMPRRGRGGCDPAPIPGGCVISVTGNDRLPSSGSRLADQPVAVFDGMRRVAPRRA
jgi:hypothetical protein